MIFYTFGVVAIVIVDYFFINKNENKKIQLKTQYNPLSNGLINNNSQTNESEVLSYSNLNNENNYNSYLIFSMFSLSLFLVSMIVIIFYIIYKQRKNKNNINNND